jgi:membrane associated rhomboid family serine protease
VSPEVETGGVDAGWPAYRAGMSSAGAGRAMRGQPDPGSALGTRLGVLFGFVALIWLVEVVDLLVFHGALDRAGIRPRTEGGLWGILLAPFLHLGVAHLIANTVPLLVLGWLVIVRGVRDFLWATLVVVLLGGLGVWLFGRPGTIHVGASGLVFGYLGYLLFRGLWERSAAAIAIALVAGFLYGGALWGVLPGQRGVSWEGHFFGLAGGAGAASVHRRRIPAVTAPRPAAAR